MERRAPGVKPHRDPGAVIDDVGLEPVHVGVVVEVAVGPDVTEMRPRQEVHAPALDGGRVERDPAPEGSVGELGVPEPFAHLAPALETWAYDARFLGPSIDFTGDESPVLFTEKLNLKRPHVGGPNPWHQDWPYWQFADDRSRIATAMLFLDDASLENGTLQVIPGSHDKGPWPTRTDMDVFGNLEMDPASVEGYEPVALEVPAGSVVFFGPLLVHKSEPNTSEKDRRALLFSYQPAGLKNVLEHLRSRRAEATSS